jgi:hypothetical protein
MSNGSKERSERAIITAGVLVRLRRREEQLLKNPVTLKLRIGKMLGEAGLLKMHDVFAAPRCRADENHPAEERRSIERHLLRHHAVIARLANVRETSPR